MEVVGIQIVYLYKYLMQKDAHLRPDSRPTLGTEPCRGPAQRPA